MKQQVRELLVTANVARKWENQFNEKVEELMDLVNKVDTETQVMVSGELLDVYQKWRQKPGKNFRKKLADYSDKPFEFLVFCN